MLSAALAGLAGATKALVFQLASLTDVHWTHVGRGGADDAARRHGHGVRADRRRRVIVADAELPGQLGAWVTVIQGVVFVLCVLLFREGIVGVIGKRIRQPL